MQCVRTGHGEHAGCLVEDFDGFVASRDPAERRQVLGGHALIVLALRRPGVDHGLGDVDAEIMAHFTGDLVAGKVAALDRLVQRPSQLLADVQRALAVAVGLPLRFQCPQVIEEAFLSSPSVPSCVCSAVSFRHCI